MIILSRTWEFFDEANCTGHKMTQRGPSMDPKITDRGIQGNRSSSVHLVSPAAPAAATPGRESKMEAEAGVMRITCS
jgi:hypothetical protein